MRPVLVLFCLIAAHDLPACSVPQFDPSAQPGSATVDQLLSAGHYRRALALITAEPAAETPVAAARHLYLLSKAQLGLGELDLALQNAEQAVSAAPSNAEYHLQIAAVAGRTAEHAPMFKQLGLAKRAKREIDAAYALDPHNPDVLYGLILYLWNAPGFIGGDKQKAQTFAEQLTGLDAARGYGVQATLAHERHDYAAEEALLRKSASAEPVSYDSTIALARFDGRSDAAKSPQRSDEQDELACRALYLDPQRSEAWQILAENAASDECWLELDGLLTVAQQFNPADLSPAYRAAVTIIGSGKNLERAQDLLERYIRAPQEGDQPSLGLAHYQLAKLFERQGRRDEAVVMLEAAVAEDATLDDARKDLKRLSRAN